MTDPRFEELFVPAPPYRMARPVATLATAPQPDAPLNATIGEQLAKQRLDTLGAKQEVSVKEPSKQESSLNHDEQMAQLLVEAGLVVGEIKGRVAGKEGENVRETPEGSALLAEASEAMKVAEGLVKKHTKVGAPVAASTGTPATQTPQPAKGAEQNVLQTLEEERASVEKSKGVSDAERARRLSEYDKAIQERDAKATAVKLAAEKAAAEKAAAEEAAKNAAPATADTTAAPEVLDTLEKERASVQKSKGVSDAERARRLAEYDKAIKERDAKTATAGATEAVDLQGDTAADRAEHLRIQAEEALGVIQNDPDTLAYLDRQGLTSSVDEKGYFISKDGKPSNTHATQVIGNKPAEADALRRGDERVAALRAQKKPDTPEPASTSAVPEQPQQQPEKKSTLSPEEKKKLDEVGQLRELSNLQTEQRRLEKLAQEAKASGDTQKLDVLRQGVVDLEMQIAGKRGEIQGNLSDAEMAQKEASYAQNAATVEGYERAQAKAAADWAAEDAKAVQRKAEQAENSRVFNMARQVALESSVKDIANRYNDRGALSAQEWARYKQLALEEATNREEDKAITALQNLGRILQRPLYDTADSAELALLRSRLDAGQAARGERMNAEEEAHTEAAQEHAGRMIPRPERMDMRGYLGEMLRFVTERTGNPKTWWRTFERRMNIIDSRRYALQYGEQQMRAQEKLNEANAEIQKYQAALRGAGVMDKLWNGNRLRKWQKRANQLEAQVDTMSARREWGTARHVALQQEVTRVYESRLAPYREQAADLSRRHGEQAHVRETLLTRLEEAQERLSQAEKEGGRSRWLRSSRANRCINRIKDEMNDISRRVRASDNLQFQINRQLTAAAREIATWEAKIKTASQQMQLPELEGLTARKKEAPVPMREVGGVSVTPGPRITRRPDRTVPEAGPSTPESTPAAPERDPTGLEWKISDFIEQWNNNGLQRIEDQKSFSDFVEFERRRLKETGTPTGQRLIELLRTYTAGASVKPDMKQFDRDVRFFFSNVRPRT